MGKYFFWFVLIVFAAGCTGGEGDDDEDGRSSATRVVSGASSHSGVTPGTCNTCHNGITAKGKNSGHISTSASCDACHRTTAWEPATMNHNTAAAGSCSSCHNGIAAKGKNSGHIATSASCDICHQTTAWKPATASHSSAVPGSCATCHNGTTARGKHLTHIATTYSCDVCHLTTAWIPTAFGSSASTSTIDFPVEAVLTSLASNASTYNASATDAAGNSFSLTVERKPGSDKTDPLIYPASLKTYTQSNILRKNNNIISTTSFENFYSVVPFYSYGSLNNLYGTSNVMKVSTQLLLPSTSRVGSSGVIFRGRNYINGSTVSFDTWYATWTLETDSATTAWLCTNIAVTPANAATVSTSESNCFRIDQTGSISGFKADITENGITLNYR